MARQKHQTDKADQQVSGKIQTAPPFARLTEPQAGYAYNIYAAPAFSRTETLGRVVISTPACDNRNLVASVDQTYRKIRQMLRRRNNVRIEALVEQ